ncbi:uncharacterized protein BP5553_05985 [Venustampulla echinocandica]|uniref:Uncharacterized protein n=1 Tax=Venustampulla echinocandica TaxID=2656787 RepID=A0A370TM79_9HELO|nr:uncharacterized protein BP5553_05985 [Venustampulla echinocandica]RDL36633.1 hypothetical protein BP5553_05985 [Venustampulla echinocandica]
MRFNIGSIVLGLAALSSLPESLGRAIPNSSPGAVDLYKYDSHYHARAAPIRVGSGGKGGSGKGPGGVEDNTPHGDKDGNGNPVHIGTGDKIPSGDGSGHPVRIGTGDNKDVDLWCRGLGCGASEDSTPSATLTEKEKTDLGVRGDKGVKLVASPEKGNVDYTQRQKDNYNTEEEPEFEGVDDSVPKMGLDKKYGFDSVNGWKTYSVNSKDNLLEPLIKMSFGRAKKDDKEYLAFVAHNRFAEHDGNRYKLDDNGNNVLDDNKRPVENPDKDSKAVPVSQLTYETAQLSGMLKPAEKVFLISENVINNQAQKAITAAHKALGKTGQPCLLKKDAPGPEGEHFKIIAGTDNNYSYLNTVGRNPDFFKNYDVVSIETYENPPMMNMELSKKAQNKRNSV